MKKVNLLVIGVAALLALTACNTVPSTSECEKCEECEVCEVCEECEVCEDNGYVVRFEIAEDADVFWTGRVVDGKPEGPGVLHYGLGEGKTVFTGFLNEDWTPKYGRYQYGNNMYFEGSFEHVNDGVGNYGRFTWSTSGDFRDGNTYIGGVTWNGEGGFDNQNQYGATYCPAYWKWQRGELAKSYNGLLYWSGLYGGRGFGFAGKVGEVGQGMFQFGDNSIYTGDLRCDAEWGFTRIGWGWNEWIVDEYSAWITGGSADLLIVGFEGEFDGNPWIKGNGTWYLKNASNEILYIKGTWNGGTRTGDATRDLPLRFAGATEIVL